MSRLITKSGSCCSSEEDVERLRRGPWTDEEDTLLTHYITSHGEGRWNLLANRSGLKRTGKSCRLRWLNYLKPDVKRGNLTPQEQLMILELHSKFGNRWSKIAQHLPGRTDNEIKNYWRTRVQKQARHLKIDSNSTAFQEVIRCFWMPRLLQKIQGPPPFEIPFQNSANTHPLNHTPPSPPLPPLLVSGVTCSFDHKRKNSSLDNSTSPSISSSEPIHVSQFAQMSEYPTSPFDAIGNIDYSTYLKGPYSVDTISCDMETFSLAPAMGDFKDPIGDRHTVGNNWIDDDLADNLWNMDELWQFRQLQEISGT